ncbi:MAG: RrF2 family transcriptional regulator [Oscillospiraceae bacterium]
MHITLESDYAIRIVHCLCKNGKRMDARTISESTGVTLRFSLKILRKLVSSKIIRSFKGSQGGYEIARNPGEISLREVIEVVEGPISSAGAESRYFCTREKNKPCKVQKTLPTFRHGARETRERDFRFVRRLTYIRPPG